MARLIVRCNYFRGTKSSRHKANHVKYIGTREGVELNPEMLKYFFEDDDIESKKDNYIEYLANRPGAVKEFGSMHGLFSTSDSEINLEGVMEQVATHTAPVWISVVSMKREDAHMLGYENIGAWRSLFRRHIDDMVKSFRIDAENLEWYAAFHNESHHPHCHLVIFDRNAKQGHLSKKGIETFRSSLANDVFRRELTALYQYKSNQRATVKQTVRKELTDAMRKVEDERRYVSKIYPKMCLLSEALRNHKGKKKYGYLNKATKQMVNEIVELLQYYPTVREAYEKWMAYEKAVRGFYAEEDGFDIPLVQNREFVSIKNDIIAQALDITPTEVYQSKQGNSPLNDIANTSQSLLRSFEQVVNSLIEDTKQTQQQGAVDSKERAKIKRKRQALGQKQDDDEDEAQVMKM